MRQKEVKNPVLDAVNKDFKPTLPDHKYQLKLVLSNISDIVFQTDHNGCIIASNKPYLKYTTEELIGINISEVFTDENKQIHKIHKTVIKTGVSQTFEYNYTKLNKWYLLNFIPLDNEGSFIVINDITESKSLFESKTFEQDFITKLVDIAHIIVLVLDKNGQIVKVNPYLENITGYSLKEIEGKDWITTFIPVEEQNRIKKILKSVFINDVPNQGIVNSIVTKNGKLRTIEWYDKTLKDSKNKIIGLLALGHDITERVIAEKALQTSTTQLTNAMKIAKIGYWEYDFENDLFNFNDQFYSVFRTTVEEVGGYTMSVRRYIELFVHADDRKAIREFIQNAKESNSIIDGRHIEHRIKFSDGGLAYISVRIIALRDEKGNVLKILGANQDVTERVKFEEAIRTSEAQLSNAMEIARLGYWELDVDQNVFIFNDHFYSIFRTTAEEVGGYKMSPEDYSERFLYPDDKDMVINETRLALETKDPNYSKKLEHRIYYSDGEIGYISVNIYIEKDKEGRTIKTYGANQDITERKKIEKKLEEQNAKYASLNLKLEESLEIVKKMNIELEYAKNKAEENDKLKSAFLANMSHEIRTPMNGIIGFAKMLNKKGLSDERKLQYTGIINDMSHQLLRMIDEIIDISMIETGQMTIHKSKTNINDICISLFSLYKSTAEKNNINLYVQKGLSDDHSEILTDNTKFRQVLDNLLRNAIKFTHQGYVKFGYQLRDDGNLEFYVEDTGIGIVPEMQITIFERFRQAEEGVTREYGGTGLGLSISKSLIEKLGGKIWVKSVPDEGSTFYFIIPYIPTTISGVNYLEESKKENQPKIPTILVVEDEEINYLYIEEVLLECDLKILHAKRGKEALELYKMKPEIDLILLDIKLPDLNGIEVMKQIKEINPSMPIIAQTAYALAGDMESAIEAGFDDYIAKPIDDKELIQKIGQYLSVNKSL